MSAIFVRYRDNNSKKYDGKLYQEDRCNVVSLNGREIDVDVSAVTEFKEGDSVIIKYPGKGGSREKSRGWNAVVTVLGNETDAADRKRKSAGSKPASKKKKKAELFTVGKGEAAATCSSQISLQSGGSLLCEQTSKSISSQSGGSLLCEQTSDRNLLVNPGQQMQISLIAIASPSASAGPQVSVLPASLLSPLIKNLQYESPQRDPWNLRTHSPRHDESINIVREIGDLKSVLSRIEGRSVELKAELKAEIKQEHFLQAQKLESIQQSIRNVQQNITDILQKFGAELSTLSKMQSHLKLKQDQIVTKQDLLQSTLAGDNPSVFNPPPVVCPSVLSPRSSWSAHQRHPTPPSAVVFQSKQIMDEQKQADDEIGSIISSMMSGEPTNQVCDQLAIPAQCDKNLSQTDSGFTVEQMSNMSGGCLLEVFDQSFQQQTQLSGPLVQQMHSTGSSYLAATTTQPANLLGTFGPTYQLAGPSSTSDYCPPPPHYSQGSRQQVPIAGGRIATPTQTQMSSSPITVVDNLLTVEEVFQKYQDKLSRQDLQMEGETLTDDDSERFDPTSFMACKLAREVIFGEHVLARSTFTGKKMVPLDPNKINLILTVLHSKMHSELDFNTFKEQYYLKCKKSIAGVCKRAKQNLHRKQK